MAAAGQDDDSRLEGNRLSEVKVTRSSCLSLIFVVGAGFHTALCCITKNVRPFLSRIGQSPFWERLHTAQIRLWGDDFQI